MLHILHYIPLVRSPSRRVPSWVHWVQDSRGRLGLLLGNCLHLPFGDSLGQADFPVALQGVRLDVAANVGIELLFRLSYLFVIHGLFSFCGQGTCKGSLGLSGSLLNALRSRYFRPAGTVGRKASGEIQGRGVSREEKSEIRVSTVATLVGVFLISAVHGPAPAATGGGPFFCPCAGLLLGLP